MDWEIHTADILNWAAGYDGPKFHALLCDPPYELKFMGKRWDATGISFQPDTWAALAEHLHPGAVGGDVGHAPLDLAGDPVLLCHVLQKRRDSGVTEAPQTRTGAPVVDGDGGPASKGAGRL